MVIKNNSKILSTDSVVCLENKGSSKLFVVEYDHQNQLIKAVQRTIQETNKKYLWRLTTDKGTYITTHYSEFLTTDGEWVSAYSLKKDTTLISIPYECGVDISKLIGEGLVNGNVNYGKLGLVNTQKVKNVSFAHRSSCSTADADNFIIFPEQDEIKEGLVVR